MNTTRADINSVLMQMRELQMQAQSQTNKPGGPVEGAVKADAPDFGDMLSNAVDNVNDQQMASKELATAYELGDPRVDLTQVMISMQKASLSFQAMTQVRNRLVSAYEDIMNMPV